MSDTSKNVELFKEVMGNYPTGVTVVTTNTEDGVPLGLTVNSFASVSIDPLLILWSIDKRVSSFDVFTTTNKFAVNVLASDQADVCTLFASRVDDRFANTEWEQSKFGVPVLKNVAGVFECEVFNRVEAGDHMILIGKVVEIDSGKKEPLLYHKRTFGPIPSEFYSVK
ncbi:flavin reductase family protein [Alkalihalobacillus pseudalcaliphilus]|uniref:flavin reductase family protein n=1 Tax=Alkalihalobacillus pseudalcaliphilus TaxID=79884 RepID=UPI00064DAB69|nr:flavin reductase family protein [Alkalihalobacillus pseudalcaliphilus]KMK76196.1 oxygenase [Alkalihalobacillus pseudalcaliphilus]